MTLGNFFFSNSGAAAGYQIEQSLRFDGSAYLSRTPSSAGNRNTWTSSYWIKKAPAETSSAMHTWSSTQFTAASFNGGSTSTLTGGTDTATVFNTTAKYRDSSAWMHIVARYDSTQSGSNKYRIYVNGAEYTGPWLTDNRSSLGTSSMNNTVAHYIGNSAIHGGTTFAFQGYIAEFHHVDGSSLDPTSFGEYDENGVWRAIEVSGLTYSTNGFYLKFDPSATNGIGHDHSGNGNNFTATGFTTSGTGTDVMSDTPTNNWCTLNPLITPGNTTLTNGNLEYSTSQAEHTLSSFGMTEGKWYCEATLGSSANIFVGLVNGTQTRISSTGSTTLFVIANDGANYYPNSTRSYNGSTSLSAGDVVGLALDATNKSCNVYKNNTLIYTFDTFTLSGPYYFAFDRNAASPTVTNIVNFGQRAFAYTPPTDFLPLNTSNLPAPTVKDGSKNFNTVLYTGTGATQSITGVGFQPDWVWLKARSFGYNHYLYDVLRGTGKALQTNQTNTEETRTGLTAFDSDGFTLGSQAGDNNLNTTYVAWNWLAGGTGSSNTAGSITSTVSANPTAGFSIVAYTGNGSNSQTVGHGLGVAPRMCIGKSRASNSWFIRHESLGSNLNLNFNGSGTVTPGGGGLIGDLTSSTTISLPGGSNAGSGNMNANGTNYIMYCFAEIEGYSKFGSYNGNSNNDGPFVYCGFRPAWILLKSTSSGSWELYDTTRDTYNQSEKTLEPNNSAQEASGYPIDILSNGFKVRTSNTQINYSSYSYIFAAFAENPFGGDGVSPATAR